jgi:hypothetical protein
MADRDDFKHGLIPCVHRPQCESTAFHSGKVIAEQDARIAELEALLRHAAEVVGWYGELDGVRSRDVALDLAEDIERTLTPDSERYGADDE